jgi:exodeoxyribonuclease X
VFRVCDFETTGFSADDDEIIEIGACDLIVDRGALVGRTTPLAHLCNPERPIPPTARAVHHISDAMVAAAQYTPADLVARLVGGAAAAEAPIPTVLVAHNAQFEASFVGRHWKEPLPWLCTYRLAKHLWTDAPAYGNEVLRYWKLPELEIPGVPHRAEHDVRVTTELFLLLLADWLEWLGPMTGEKTPADLIAYAERPIFMQGRVGFGKHAELTWGDVPRDYLQWMVRQGKDAWDRDTWHTIHRLLGWTEK